MVLDLPGGLFGQDDVRETATVTVGTSYLSINPAQFTTGNPDVNDINLGANSMAMTGNGIRCLAHINLPHNAIVTGCIVYGSISNETWELIRADPQIGRTTMATANFNSEDTSISNATIDNLNFNYVIETSTLDTTDQITGALITYTI